MSASVEAAGFDVEAQLLENSEEEGLSNAQTNRIFNARQTWMGLIVFLRSTEVFKLRGAEYAGDITSSSSNSPGYASVTSSNEIPTQGSGNVADHEISADSTEEGISSDVPASDSYEHNNGLQQIQRENITEIVNEKNLPDLRSFGGVSGVAEALNTDLENGISRSQQMSCHCKPSQLSQFLLMVVYSFLEACNNYTILLLSCAAVLSLVFGIKEEGWRMGWFNGGVLTITILIIVSATTIHNCWQEWSNNKSENLWHSKGRKLQVRVVREGLVHFVSEIDLVAGDIVVLQKGNQVPADGLFIRGQGLEVDKGWDINSNSIDENNPFLFYGSRVINGNARMLVTSTQMDTVWGELMSQTMEMSADTECKFETCLHKLTSCVQTAGLLIAILILIVLFFRYIAEKSDAERRFRPDSKGEPTKVRTIVDAIKGIISGSRWTTRVLTTLSISLMGIMDGIPVAISVAAFIWRSKTLANKASGRDYLACIKMARVTTIVTDKFGGMAEHEVEIDKFYVGEEFVSESSVVAPEVLEGLCDGIGTEFLVPTNDRHSKLLRLISWTEEKLGMKRESVIDQCRLVDHRGHNPLQEPCKVLIQKNGNGGYLHFKGPPQDVIPKCSHYYSIHGQIWRIDGDKESRLEMAIKDMLAEEAEVIAYACKPINDIDAGSVEPNQLILLAMISMKETKMEETREAVSMLMKGGIRTILASSDDVSVLEPIGQKYGLLTHGSVDDQVVTAEEFRVWTDEDRMDKVANICIIGNCLPSDKILLIKCLKERGKVVALLAQRTVDAPALKQADIGVTSGSWSSEVARECSDISIWDGNCFDFLVNFIENSRCFQENIRKFIQLQLIVAISSSMINFVAVVFWGDAPITAVQLFWLNLVVGLVGGLALLTRPSTTTLTTMLPVHRSSAKLITKAMWRNIVIQVSYQTTMFVTLQHKGQAILGTSGGHVKPLIYNGFFLCQMFNKFIAREPEKKNIFSGLFHNNCWFWVALVLFIICQAGFAVAEVVLGGSPGLNLKLWGACLLIGLVSWLLDCVGKIASNFIARWRAADQVETRN